MSEKTKELVVQEAKMELNIDINEATIKNLIYVIRGQQVMLDKDLAFLYQVETGALNRAVKRNIKRFPESFCFQLSEEEYENLRCQIGISSQTVDKVPHSCAGFFFARCQKVQYLCGLSGTFLV